MTEKLGAYLINAPTQARKTQYFFKMVNEKYKDVKNTLMIFLTQSNNLMAVDQIVNRMYENTDFTNIFNNIDISKNIMDILYNLEVYNTENYVIADFWNSRNIKNVYEFFYDCSNEFDKLIIVYSSNNLHLISHS
jgi:hypothetical protein